MSKYCDIICPEKFNGNEENVKSFLNQFKIAGQINTLEDYKTPFWFV